MVPPVVLTALPVAGLFALIALISSRAILLFHEFAGHGLAAVAVGGEITAHRLFLFGGGWIRYRKAGGFDTADELVLSLAGLAIEIVLALAALVLARRRPRGAPLQIAALGFAGIALVHVGFYLAAGTHHGFGDGLVLHRLLGPAAIAVVAAASALAVTAAWLAARWLTASIPGLPAGRRRAAALLTAVVGAAVAVHGGLYAIERHIADDPTYAEVMRVEAEREARRALAAELARRRAAGRPMGSDEARARRRQLVDERSRLPIRPILIALIAAAAAAGALRQRSRCDAAPIAWRDLAAPALIALGLVAVVAVLATPFY